MNERCTWVTSPGSGFHYSSCGEEYRTQHEIAGGKRRKNTDFPDKPDVMELCPGCRRLVEHATWDEVEGEVSEESDGTVDCDHEWAAIHRTQHTYICQKCETRQEQFDGADHEHNWMYDSFGNVRQCTSCSKQERTNKLPIPEDKEGKYVSMRDFREAVSEYSREMNE